MVRNPILALSRSALIRIFSNEKLRLKAITLLQAGKVERFADELMLQCLGAALPEHFHIKVTGSTRARREAMKAATTMTTAEEKNLQDALIHARRKYSKNAFPDRIARDTANYTILLKLMQKIKDKYQQFKAQVEDCRGDVPDFNVFVFRYITFAMESGLISTRKWSIGALIEDTVNNYIGVALSEWMTCLCDPNESLTREMLTKFHQIFSHTYINDFSIDFKNRAKIIRAVELLLDTRSNAKDQSEEATRKYIPLWVKAAHEAYTSITGKNQVVTKGEFQIAVGCIAGTTREDEQTAVQRYLDYVKNLQVQHAKTKQPKPRIKKGWD